MEQLNSSQNDETASRRRYLEAQFTYEAAATAIRKKCGLEDIVFEEEAAKITAIVSGEETAYARAVEEFANATMRYIADRRPQLLNYRVFDQFCLGDLGKIRDWKRLHKEAVLNVFHESNCPHVRDEAVPICLYRRGDYLNVSVDVIDFGMKLLYDLSDTKLAA